MKKQLLTLLFVMTFFSFTAVSASAIENETLKVGLRYGSSAMFSANLENHVGSGYQFGYFDGDRAFVPVAQTGIRMDYENNLVILEQAGLTVGDLRGMLDNSSNVIIMDDAGIRLEDETIAKTGTGIKVTNNGQLFKMVVIGDLDGNGILDSGDARIALRVSVGLDESTPAMICAGDTDGNGQLTAGDARTLLRRSVGLE